MEWKWKSRLIKLKKLKKTKKQTYINRYDSHAVMGTPIGYIQVLFWSGSFTGLCLFNFRLSKWIFYTCGSNLWYFVPVSITVFTTLSCFVYLLTTYITSVYLRHLMRSLDQTDLVEFSLLMSKFKENQCSKLLTMNNPNAQLQTSCLICYDYAAKTITKPCGHQVMCGSCAWKYVASSIRDCSVLRCILCRTEVAEYKGDIAVVLDKFNMDEITSIVKMKKLKRIRANNFAPCSG